MICQDILSFLVIICSNRAMITNMRFYNDNRVLKTFLLKETILQPQRAYDADNGLN